MAFKIFDRVQETTATTGVGTVTLGGAVSGYRTFASVLSNADTCPYLIVSGTDWEVGIGTFTASGTTLARTTIKASSNSGSAISLAGTSNIVMAAISDFFKKSVSQTAPASPTGTSSTTPTMMGLAGSITPVVTGNVLILVTGHFNCDGGANPDGGIARLRYGTGSAPSNAATATGTATGTTASFVIDASTISGTTGSGGIMIQSYITGLTVGTSYWIDIDLASVVGGTVSAHEVVITAVEL